MIPLEEFKKIVKNTVLVAIDLIIENPDGKILLGLRKNNPAKGFLFVPGGRIFKNESFGKALKRISKEEIGIEIDKNDVELMGIYEHIYKENYFEDRSFNTHYVVIACKTKLDINSVYNNSQHKNMFFMSKKELLNSKVVHQLTKNYFVNNAPPNKF
ncbi:MAG: NUDIX domain-containing protein [Armatimonadetes bacterium]|nr:NUDIX domain-containing protein [Armatimonadota bacterium]